MQRSRIRFLVVVACLLVGAAAGSVCAQDDEAPAVRQLEDPREILERYPAFRTTERVPILEDDGYYPCSDCHDNEFQIANPVVRELEEMHDDIRLAHGGGRFWCLTCHAEEDRDQLWSLKQQLISFDEPYLLCGQCHFQRQKDFFFGAHGKRKDSWQGERVLAPCTECHDPHNPKIQPQAPVPPPKARAGLELPSVSHHAATRPWKAAAERRGIPPADEDHGDDHDDGEPR